MSNPKQFKRLAANGTFVIASHGAMLGSVIVNSVGATGNTLTIYNNSAGSGDIVAVIDTTSSNMPQRDYNIMLSQGLTCVMATGTTADITITYEGSL